MSRIERDVPPFMLVEGNPSRVRALNSVALKRNNFTPEEIKELKEAYRILYRSGLTLTHALEKLSSMAVNDKIKTLYDLWLLLVPIHPAEALFLVTKNK